MLNTGICTSQVCVDSDSLPRRMPVRHAAGFGLDDTARRLSKVIDYSDLTPTAGVYISAASTPGFT